MTQHHWLIQTNSTPLSRYRDSNRGKYLSLTSMSILRDQRFKRLPSMRRSYRKSSGYQPRICCLTHMGQQWTKRRHFGDSCRRPMSRTYLIPSHIFSQPSFTKCTSRWGMLRTKERVRRIGHSPKLPKTRRESIRGKC